jgi:hypothetical protein
MLSSNTVQISSLLTVKGKVDIATSIIEEWAESNTYIGIGHVSPWPGGIENSTTYGTIPIPNNSTDSENFVYDNLVALKRITGADMALVVPRVDWQTGVVYTPYANNTEMFSTENDVLLSGTVNATVGSNTLIGSSATHFSTDFSVGNLVKFVNPTTNYVTIKEIVSIANDKNLTVNSISLGGTEINLTSMLLVNIQNDITTLSSTANILETRLSTAEAYISNLKAFFNVFSQAVNVTDPSTGNSFDFSNLQ